MAPAGSTGPVTAIQASNGKLCIRMTGWFRDSKVKVFPCDVDLVDTEDVAELGCEQQADPKPKRARRGGYSLAETKTFQTFVDYFKNFKLNQVVNRAKELLPSIFPRLKHEQAKLFPDKIKQKEMEAAAAQTDKKVRRKKKVKLLGQKGNRTHAPSLQEKEAELTAQIQKSTAGSRGNNSILPASLVLSIGLLLYSQFLAGVPMNTTIAQPMILSHIEAEGFSHLLHSQQSAMPLIGTMKANGITPEAGKMMWTQNVVNEFYRKIGLTMRQGTGCYGKKVQPDEVAGLRELQMYRLLYVVVTENVPAKLVFQMDETGVMLLPFSKKGRAQSGASEVKWHGCNEKRQFTLSPIIDGENELVRPCQMIWGGTEFCAKTGERLDLSCPRGKLADEHSENLYHTQTGSHWCTLGSLMLLITTLAAHVEAVCEHLGLDYEAQAWIFVMDCYSVHICKEFLEWCQTEFPNLKLLYVFANCTEWLQPLDLSWNGPFKSILRTEAGTWLAKYVAEQLRICKDPAKVQLNVKKSYLQKFFTSWVSRAVEKMAAREDVVQRGWDLSGMWKALRLAKQGKGSEEFETAAAMNQAG